MLAQGLAERIHPGLGNLWIKIATRLERSGLEYKQSELANVLD